MRLRTRTSYWLPLMILTVAGVLAGLSVAHRRSQLVALRARDRSLCAEVVALERQKAGMRETRNRLLSDPGAIERAAREHYGFAAKGEKVADVQGMPPRRPPEPPLPSPKGIWGRILVWLTYPWMVPVGVYAMSALVLTLLSPRVRVAVPATPSPAES